jgi:hypothetical protein
MRIASPLPRRYRALDGLRVFDRRPLPTGQTAKPRMAAGRK